MAKDFIDGTEIILGFSQYEKTSHLLDPMIIHRITVSIGEQYYFILGSFYSLGNSVFLSVDPFGFGMDINHF